MTNPIVKKTDSQAQIGLINFGNTCYLHTAIQMLLVWPDLQAMLSQKLSELPPHTTEPTLRLKQRLCELLLLLLEKQHGHPIDPNVIEAFWASFNTLFQQTPCDTGVFGSRQEDCQFAYGKLLTLLDLDPKVYEKRRRQYEAVQTSIMGTFASEIVEEPVRAMPVLAWEEGAALPDLFAPSVGILEDAKHPRARDFVDNLSEANTNCTVFTEVNIEPASVIAVVPDFSKRDAYGMPHFVPEACHYQMPAEFTVNIDNRPVTYVLAAFGKKTGGMGGGHYIAYRREGENWFELNDDRVSPLGRQPKEVLEFPGAVSEQLTASHAQYPRQLIYVEKSRFWKQYHPEVALPVIDVPEDEPVSPTVEPVPKLVDPLIVPDEGGGAIKVPDLDRDILLSWFRMIQAKNTSGEITTGFTLNKVNLHNRLNWHILAGILNYYRDISKIVITTHADEVTQKNCQAFLADALKNRKGRITLSFLPHVDESAAQTGDEAGSDAEPVILPKIADVCVGKQNNRKRQIWHYFLLFAAVSTVVTAFVAAPIVWGILLGVTLASAALDVVWYFRNANFRDKVLEETYNLVLHNTINQYLPVQENESTLISYQFSPAEKAGYEEVPSIGKYWGRLWGNTARAEGAAYRKLGIIQDEVEGVVPVPPPTPKLTR